MTFRDRWQRVVHSRRPSSSLSNITTSSSPNSATYSPLNQNPTLAPARPITMLAMNGPPVLSPRSTSPTTTISSTRSRFRLSKTFMWSSSKTSSSNKKKTHKNPSSSSADNDEEEWYGPMRMKYRGPVNKKHQKVLESFEWKFGRNASLSGASSRSGISPCASRSASLVC